MVLQYQADSQMECPLCMDIYNQSPKIPRNLQCGHTFCEECLKFDYAQKNILECPMCKLKHDAKLRPHQLAKNYIALEFSLKKKEMLDKHEFCPEHNEPLKFYCENDSEYICIDCITKHIGHRFFKQEQSIILVKKTLGQKISQLKEETKILEEIADSYDSTQNNLDKEYQKHIGNIQSTFEALREGLTNSQQKLKNQFKQFYQGESTELNSNKLELTKEKQAIAVETKSLQDKIQGLGNVKVLEEIIEVPDYKPKRIKNPTDPEFPIVQLKLLQTPKVEMYFKDKSKICFFGDRKKILTFCPVTKTFTLSALTTPIEIQFYSACCTLPSGDILIVGGGSSSATILFSPWTSTKLQYKRNMISCRKEHACVYMNGYAYAISGYDNKNRCMAGCERYDPRLDEWRSIAGLNTPRCAFAVVVMNNKIWVLGGYNGEQRIDTIESYDQTVGKWEVMGTRLPICLSNSAAVAFENCIMIIGGGSNDGFNFCVYKFDTETKLVSEVSRMDTGRDLRNKAIVFRGELYTIGGANSSAQKYRIRSNKWEQVQGYQDLLRDNLDSWCCALMYFPSNCELTAEDQQVVSCMSKKRYKELQKSEDFNDDYF